MPPKKGKEDFQRYVKLDDDMTNSAAWDSLSDSAVRIYIELRKKYNHMNGGNDRLILPRNEILHRMNHHTFAKKKRELIARGFIDCVDPGGLPQRPAIYRLSDRWKAISRELVTTRSREAIRSGVKRTFDTFTGEYSKQHLNFQKKDGEKKEIDRYILKGGSKEALTKVLSKGQKRPLGLPRGQQGEASKGSKEALSKGQKRPLHSKDKKKKKTGLEDLTESELITRLQSGEDPGIILELENRGCKVASMRTQ